MTLLAGQKVLLIGIGFYDYEAAIAAEFRALGAKVRVEDERPPEMRGRLAGLYRRVNWDMTAARARHYAAMLERVRSDGVLDHVVVIKGTLLDESFLCALRDAQPSAQFTAYHWDSMARFPELIDRQRLFDRVLTFDHVDAATHPGFKLRPLFFRPELTRAASPGAGTFDICFVGWLHHQRLVQVEALRAQAEALGVSGFYYLFTGRWSLTKLRLAGRGRDVRSRPLPFAPYADAVAASAVILDLPHPLQTGLTMRAVEAVGAGKKLITTARDVVKYDFYRAENICIIDPEAPRLDPDFFARSGVQLPPELVNRYSLRAWCLDVLGISKPGEFLGEHRDCSGHRIKASA